MDPGFVHLRTHSEYSIIDGIVRINPLLDKCQALAMPAIAISDQSHLFAAVKFYKAAIKRGIKPLFASDLWLVDDHTADPPYHRLLALCQNQIGYKNLTRLISKAYLEGQQKGCATIKRAWLQQYNEGLILLSGGQKGDLGQALLTDNSEKIKEYLAFYQQWFANRYYIELQRIGRDQEEQYNQKAIHCASTQAIPVVATNDIMFIDADDFEAHEARVCINGGYILQDPKRPKQYTQQQYLRSIQEMQTLFSDLPEALKNTVEIAKRCNVSLTLGEYYLPNFPVPAGKTVEQFFAEEAQKGLKKRMLLLGKRADDMDVYQQRLQRELDVINQMGYAGYFLIVADFIQWAKNNGVAVGPGRGSGAGSLVAYVLEITDLDPLHYDLLFERFLNPERVSMPDFDIDFCMEGRDRVIEYVAGKYGQACVAQIITYGTMAAKAVVRDVGRVMAHPYGFIDKIAKLIPFEIGMTLDNALAQEQVLQDRYNQEDDVSDGIDLART
jgi:DNA polymerase III subunit alpha